MKVETADCLLMQGAFQLFIRIDDRDDRDGSVRLQRVDDIFVERSITPSLAYTNNTTNIGENGLSTIELSFRVTCSENFFGPNCTTFCVPMDSVQGHYTCDQDGGIVCNAGYTNTSTNCVECLPAEGCCESPLNTTYRMLLNSCSYILCVVMAAKTKSVISNQSVYTNLAMTCQLFSQLL